MENGDKDDKRNIKHTARGSIYLAMQ